MWLGCCVGNGVQIAPKKHANKALKKGGSETARAFCLKPSLKTIRMMIVSFVLLSMT